MKLTITTVSGEVKPMHFQTKADVLAFIDKYAEILPVGITVCVDAPLAGIHNGWLRGKKTLVTN